MAIEQADLYFVNYKNIGGLIIMAAVSARKIVDAILGAFREAGASAYYVSDKLQTHPRKFQVSLNGRDFSIWIYIWSLTHGGRAALPNEYRIQMTSVTSPLPNNPAGHTAILGYHGELEMFAGFDLQKHQTFTEGSPSIQIDISAINAANDNGLAFFRKTNDEIAVGIRPDLLFSYIADANSLHTHGANVQLLDLLNLATNSEEDIPEKDIKKLSKPRRVVVSEVIKLSRDAAFKKNVIHAYAGKCAVTKVQLRLLDAAHILPVLSEDSSDDVSNGIALSPTIHRAFDNCLIFLDEDFVMQINQEKVEELTAQNLHGGLSKFKKFLGKKISLPKEKKNWPHVDYIKLANKLRRIPGY